MTAGSQFNGIGVDAFADARAIADAVLYEGYVLYPYRASARKNQMRWQFGVIVPRRVQETDVSERSSMRTECIVDPGEMGTKPRVQARVRCLQVQARTLERVAADDSSGAETGFVPTDELEAGGSRLVPWDEAVEHEIDLPDLVLLPLSAASTHVDFVLPARCETELVRNDRDRVIGRITRECAEVRGRLRACAFWAEGHADLLQLAVTVENTSDWFEPGSTREVVTRHSIVAAHTMLAIEGGRFVSLLDPPVDAAGAVAGCTNAGSFPVLVGAPGATDLVLSSPIILYDYPAIAPESPGDLYDATEIDEILALRVLTLTDEEKAEARATDRRAAAIVDRCDDMDTADFAQLHGTMRPFAFAVPEPAAPEKETAWWDPGVDGSVDPDVDAVRIAGVDVRKGTSVRLHPGRRADAHDMFLAGLTATVAAVFRDVDGNDHVAVTLDDDPAAEVFQWQKRYLYFAPEEIEPVRRSEPAS